MLTFLLVYFKNVYFSYPGTKPSYKYTTMDGKMFTLITSETTFSVAKEMCKYWGGKLAEEPASNLRLARSDL